MKKCNVKDDYWQRPFKFVTKNSQIQDSTRPPLLNWGFPQTEKSLWRRRPEMSMNNRIQRMVDTGLAAAKYMEDHPSADWKEIFDNVPNHYSDEGNMRDMFNKLVKRGLICR